MRRTTLARLATAWLMFVACAMPGYAASLPPPADLNQRVGYDQHLDAALPLDVPIVDADGRTTTLSVLMRGKPLLLAFGYYRCPNLCDLTLHGMAMAIAGMKLVPGADYQVAFISIDPTEIAKDAMHARSMLRDMAPRGQVDRWLFATAPAESIRRLTAAAGFRYLYDARNHQYAHPAGLIVVTGDGKIAQYVFGVSHDPKALNLALVDASHGHIGSIIDQLVLFCCDYDPATGRYSLLVSRLMMVLGCGFVVVMLGLWLRLRGRHA